MFVIDYFGCLLLVFGECDLGFCYLLLFVDIGCVWVKLLVVYWNSLIGDGIDIVFGVV